MILETMFKSFGLKLSRALSNGVKKGAVGPLKDDSLIWRTLRQAIGGSNDSVVDNPYEQCVWIYSSVNAIATNISSLPFKLYTGTEDSKKELTSGPVHDLFETPNPYMTRRELIEATFIYLGIRGEAVWIIERENVSAMPKEIWCFDPDRFSPVVENGNISGWIYSKGNEEVYFYPWEIVFFKEFNPDDDIRGLAPWKAASLAVDQDWYAGNFNKSFFRDGATTAGFIEVEEELGSEAFTRLISQFEERHSGYSRAHKVGVLEGGAKWKDVKLTHQDMEFINLKKMDREEIFACYKTNSVVLGFYDEVKSYDGINAAHKAFWLECLIPKLKKMEDLLRYKFFKSVSPTASVWVEFDIANVPSLKEDYFRKVESANILANKGWPINAINERLELGFDPVPWGNTWWIDKNTIPVEAWKLNLETTTPDTDDTADDDDDSKGNGKSDKTLEQISDVIAEDYETIRKKYLSKQAQLEKVFISKTKRAFFEQRQRVLKSLNSYFNSDIKSQQKSIADVIFDIDRELKEMSKIFSPLYALALRAGQEMIAEELNKDFTFQIDKKENLFYISNRTNLILLKMLNSIRTKLEATILEGMDSKESLEDISNRVRDLYNLIGNKSWKIGRTESAGVIAAGRFIAMKLLGVTEHKWVTLGDESVRATHKELEGKVVEIGKSFVNGMILRYPSDIYAPPEEVIACRCFTIPVVEESGG